MEPVSDNPDGVRGAPPRRDEVFYALYNLRTELIFIGEYRAQFEALRDSDLELAENMLRGLEFSTEAAQSAYSRLVELLLVGKGIDRSKPLPRDLRLTRSEN